MEGNEEVKYEEVAEINDTEEWTESESSIGEDSDHSSDMDVSSDNEEGKLYLEIGEITGFPKVPYHIL